MTDIDTLKKSLLMIKKLKKLLQEQNNKLFDPIAIIGMSCRLPKANNLHEFWDLLCQGQNIISSIPDERWELLKNTSEITQRDDNLNYWGGYLSNIDKFDAYFFGISSREAVRMDPQQRLLLEVSYEAFEDAGMTIDALAGSNTGVFSSLYTSQFGHLQRLESDRDALFLPTGSAISIAANRLSYVFDLRGPSMVLDTACSSSLIAVQVACLNLQAKLCDQAVVNAVNINLLPSLHSVLSKATMLSPTGQCKTFDAAADGYVQGEGAGALILKPLSKALKDKDRIYAVITGSAVNQDGKTNGLTAPNGLQQEALLRAAYSAAKIDPRTVSYIECHGTGTFLGDPIEAQALGEVIGKNRDQTKPCWISSVKTNLGHLEPAAGIVSMIKVALALKNKVIPPHLNFTSANPHIPLAKYGLTIPRKLESFPSYSHSRIAGVSGFGFGGANAHIVMRELEEQPLDSHPISHDLELFTVSAKDLAALNCLISLWCDFLNKNKQINLAQLCYNAHVKRSHYSQRLAIVTHSVEDLLQKLSDVQVNYQSTNNNVFINLEIKKSNNLITEFDGIDLSTLANHYVNNATIDWKKYEKDRFYASFDMPLYPWQHKKYWPVLGNVSDSAVNPSYPMRGKFIASPLSLHQFEFIFDTKILPEIQDSFNVLHAGYYIEMLAYAMNHLHHTIEFTTQNLEYLSPLLVLNERTVLVQLIIKSGAPNSSSFSFYSYDGKENWIGHAKGNLHLKIANHRYPLDSKKDFINRSVYSGNSKTFYKRIRGMGMPIGDTLRWTQQYWLGANEILCELRESKRTERADKFVIKMHPGIIDACIQTLFLLLPDKITKPYVASHMGQVEFCGTAVEPKYIYTRLKEFKSGGENIIGDWYLLDKNQDVIVKCTGLCMTQLSDTMQINKLLGLQFQFHLDLSLPYEENKASLIAYLIEQFSIIFAMPKEDISVHHSLLSLGMDSLMALAVMRIIETSLGVTYSLPTLMQGPSISDIAEQVLAEQSISIKKDSLKPNKSLNNLWIVNRIIQPKAKLRLFCFPYGGGGASIYREWQQQFPDSIEICPVQLPGREHRLEEKPFDNLDTLVPLLAKQLNPEFNVSFAFFGHSFGSLIGFELTRYLRRNNMSPPKHLFVSAYPDPRMPSKSLNNLLKKLSQVNLNLFDLNQERISQLTDEELTSLSIIFNDNGIVNYNDDRINKSIIQMLLPVFIGDMNIVKNYTYRDELPLQLPLTVFLGLQDAWVSSEDYRGWADHSSIGCEFQQFDSGHLFINEREIKLQIIRKITEDLDI